MAMPDFDEEVRSFVQEAIQVDAKAREVRKKAKRKELKELGKVVGEFVAERGIEKALEKGISHFVSTDISVFSLGGWTYTINPLMWTLKPWLAAKDVKKVALQLEHVYAVMNEDRGVWAKKYRCQESYECTCALRRRQGFAYWDEHHLAQYGTAPREPAHKDCQAIRNFIQAQKEAKVIKIAVNSTVVGAPFYMLYAAGRSIYKRVKGTIHQDRAQFAQHLVRSAVPALIPNQNGEVEIAERGCRRAQALIALLCGELNLKNPKSDVAHYQKTMSALVYPNGWDHVAKAFSASVVFDLGHGKGKVDFDPRYGAR